jgi:hypothetical protein
MVKDKSEKKDKKRKESERTGDEAVDVVMVDADGPKVSKSWYIILLSLTRVPNGSPQRRPGRKRMRSLSIRRTCPL